MQLWLVFLRASLACNLYILKNQSINQDCKKQFDYRDSYDFHFLIPPHKHKYNHKILEDLLQGTEMSLQLIKTFHIKFFYSELAWDSSVS